MNGLRMRVALRLRLLVFSLIVGLVSSVFTLVLVGLWSSGLGVVAVALAVGWLVATAPWLTLALLIGVDLVLLILAKGTVFVPTLIKLSDSVDRENAIMKRPREPVSLLRLAAFYTNPLMPLAMGTFTYLESKPALGAAVASLHDSIMMAPRRRPLVQRISSDWNEHRLRDAAA